MAAPAPNRPLVDRHAGARRYFRRWNKVERWKWLLTGVVLVVGLGWLAAAPVARMLGRTNTDERYSHGPLADPHAAWDANCEVCHVGHSPDEFGWGFWKAGDRWNNGFEETCLKCHAAPRHFNPDARPGGRREGACNSCHHDHRGRSFSLTRISDAHCTSCHDESMPAYHGRRPDRYTHFVTGHAEFAPLTTPPARSMKFSHALHLSPGLTAIRPPENDKLMVKGADGNPAQLSCASCHTLDDGRKGPGAYYQPVTYERHCQTCHSLGTVGEAKDGRSPIAIPHRRQPAEVRGLIEGATALDLGLGSPAAGQPAVPFVRQQPDPPAANPNLGRLKELAAAREKIVLANCRKCHDVDEKDAIRPVGTPAVWYPHAKFNHAAHRLVLSSQPGNTDGCNVCHTSYAPPAPGSALVEKEPLNLPGVETCRLCHAPLGSTKEKPGGVRYGCTDCHGYHNGEHPLQGRGALGRNPERPSLFDGLRPPTPARNP